jgi:hypothetical protein
MGNRISTTCLKEPPPADVADHHQITIYEYSENRREAERRIAKDLNGKVEWQ